MNEAKITSKGQITIPIEIRRYLQLVNGDNVLFKITDQGVIIDKSSRPLTIQERFANYDAPQDTLTKAMNELDSGDDVGEEK